MEKGVCVWGGGVKLERLAEWERDKPQRKTVGRAEERRNRRAIQPKGRKNRETKMKLQTAGTQQANGKQRNT